MANNSPTIVAASLSDDQLKKSIDSLVTHVDEAMKKMVQSTNNAVGEMEAKLKSLGNLKIDSNGTADGGASKRAKAQNAETDAVEKNIAARDKQIKKNQEAATSFDNFAKAQQVAIRSASPSGIRNADTLQTMNIQLDLLRERLREARQQYSSFVALAAHATTTGDKGLFQYATDGVHRYEQEVRNLIPQIRTLQSGIQQMGDVIAPQGHTIQNYVNSLQKANPELAALNAQYKSGTSLLQDQSTSYASATQSAQRYTEEIRKQAQAIRESQQWKEKGFVTVDGSVLSKQENIAKKKRISLEEQILNLQRQGIYLSQDQTTKEWQLVDANGRRVAFIQQENENLAKQRERVAEIANDARRLFADGFGKISFTPAPLSGVRYIYQENDERSKGLTIEQQIEKILKEQSAEYERQASTKKASNNGSQRTLNDLQSQARAIEELLEKGKRVKALGGFEFIPADMSGQTVMQQIISYHEQRKAGLLAENQALNLQLELSNAIAQAEGRITQEQEKRGKKYVAPTATDDYRQVLNNAIANKLGIDTSKVINADAQYDSIKRVNNALKQLQDAYTRMSNEERNSPIGKQTIRQMQELERQTQQLRKQMSRPISLKDAMGLSEKTLDDIAYKMQRLRSYKQGIDLTKPNAANEIKQVDEALAKLQKDADKWMSKSQQMIKSNAFLGRSWNYMKNRLAFYFTVGASTQFVKNLIEVRSQYEMNERALGILINSAERGTQIFNELSQMALVSPYTLIELSSAAKQLTAYDVAAKDVVDTTRRLADMASAVGIPIERLTYALGQIKAYGYLNSRDARMFANAGIPLVKQLSDYYTQLEGRLVSTADVYDRIKKKTIDYEQVVQVINKMTDEGGKFFDFQAKMADTLKVRLANLTLAWNNMLNDMGSSNQGVLTTGIGLLREMFLHWKDLESAIGKVAAAFGIYKAAQLVTLIWTGRITTAMGVQELVGKKLQARFASLTVAQKGFVSVATAGWAALAFVVADAWLTISRNMDEIEQLNKSIADGAKESYEAIDKMLHSSEMVSTRLSAAQGKLSDTDAAKAWEMLREQIELSAASSKELIAELLKEPDINKRVTESFNLAEKIEEANRKLSDLNDSLDVSQNSILGGLFGEGLAEDIDDYNARIKYTSDVAEWASKKNRGFWENAAMGLRALFNEVKDSFGSDANEAQDEIKSFSQKAAQTIKDELGEDVMRDVVGNKAVINEAIARVVRGMEQQFPQIRGKGKVLFETIFYDTMATEFKGAVDSQAYYYEKFLEQLKKDHASAFSGVTEDINKETFKWSSAQIDAIQKTADKVRKDLPAASQGAIDEILSQLNSTDFKVRIVAEMATTSLDNVQKQFREKFIEKPWIANDKEREKEENEANQRYGTLMRKNTESNVEYEKRISDEKKTQLELSQKNADIISKNKGKEDEYSKAVLADAQKQKEIADDRLKAINEIENKGGYDFSTKSENAAARKAAKQAESELAKALKDELSTIEKVRSIYKDLTKDGMSHANAVERATRGWDETVNAINKVLRKNGLQKLSLSKFAGVENPRELVNMLQSQLNTLLKRGAKPAEIKELQTKVNTLEVDADKYDLTKITKGLNSELDRFKEEYELAVAIDADPELGGIFADMFDLNIDQLPHTISEYAQKVTAELNKALKERGDNIQLPTIYLTKDDIDAFRKMSEDKKLNTKSFEDIQKAYQDFVSLRKKAATDVSKIASDYIREYGDLSAQIQQIEIEKNDALMKLNEIYNTDALRQTQRYLDAKFAIEDGAKRKQAKATFDALKKEADYERFFTAIDTLTKKDALSIKNKIKKGIIDAFTNGGLTISQFRKEIKALEEQFDKLSQPTSNWISYLNGGFDKLIQRAKETGQEIEAIGEKISVTGKVDEEDKNYLQSLGNIFSNGKGGNTDFSSLMSQFGKDMKGLGSNISKAGQGMQGASSNFASTVSIIDMIIKNIHQTVQGINSVIQELDSVRNEENKISNAYWEGFSKSDSYASSGWENLKSGNISGAIADTANSIISIFNTFENAKTDRINSEIKESEREVKRLENSYKILEFAADKAYGTAIAGANQATKANKELQLAELKRQLALEQSRSGKARDEDKIIQLRGDIIELEQQIEKSSKDIVNNLLDISSHGDFFEEMVSEMISAFKNGEDAMKVFEEKWSAMIDNMIMKTIVSQVLAQWINTLERGANEILNKYTEESAKKMADAESSMTNLRNMDAGDVARWIYENDKENFDKILESLGERNDVEQFFSRDMWFDQAWDSGLANKIKEAYFAMLNSNMSGLQSELDKASLDATGELIDYYTQAGDDFKQNYLDLILAKIKENWTFGQDSQKELSNLQQGISQISETTANSIEAYLNGVSQQVYYHSSLLEQIRDSVVGLDLDVSLGVQSQMLLQLQSSYQTQQAIQQILEGVLVPSGRAFAVELLS